MIFANRVKEGDSEDRLGDGTFIQTASPENAEIAAALRISIFLILDMEHGSSESIHWFT